MIGTPPRSCTGCRFWSELIAASAPETGNQFKALCLNTESPKWSAYTAPHEICGNWSSGHHGAIDNAQALARYLNEELRK